MAYITNSQRINSLLLLGILSISLLVVGCQSKDVGVEEPVIENEQDQTKSVPMTNLTEASQIKEYTVLKKVEVKNNNLKLKSTEIIFLTENSKINGIKTPLSNALDAETAVFGDSFGQIFNIILNDGSTIKGFNSEKSIIKPLETGDIIINIEDQEEGFADLVNTIYISNLYKQTDNGNTNRILYPLYIKDASETSYEDLYNELNKSDE
jgi:hypothetical protein